MPGPAGKPQVIIAHGGEQVQRVGQSGGKIEKHYHIHNEWTLHATGDVRLQGPLRRDLEEFTEEHDRGLIRNLKQIG